MTRISYIAAAAVLAALVNAPAAQACISCNYTPEVANSPAKSAPSKQYKKPAVRERRPEPEPKRSVRIEKQPKEERSPSTARQDRDDQVDTAKQADTEKPATGDSTHDVRTWTSTTGPIGTQPSSQPSAETKPATETTVEKKPESEAAKATTSTATAAAAVTPESQAASTTEPEEAKDVEPSSDEVGCKKYNAAARVTITVPCEQ